MAFFIDGRLLTSAGRMENHRRRIAAISMYSFPIIVSILV